MREIKKALRRNLIALRREMSSRYRNEADSDIFRRIKPYADSADIVFTYVSTEIEVDTRRLLQYCFDNGITAAVPVSGESTLSFYSISDLSQLAPGRYGIPEPVCREKEIIPTKRSLCVVPALCADGNGLRLGYGKGYYDRFLADFPGISVIICYCSFMREVPAEPHDVKADITIFDDINGGNDGRKPF